MSDISKWSNTAAGNSSPPPDGAPEGMNPATVNDTMREMMAATRRQWEIKEFFNFGDSPTYISVTSFSVPGNLAARYHANRRIMASGTGSMGTIYGTLSAPTYNSGPNTTTCPVTWDSGALDGTLTAVSLGAAAANDAEPRLYTQQALQAFATDTGAANAYVANLSPAPVSYFTGLRIQAKIANANTGASTLNINSLGIKNIVRRDGTALVAGDLPAGTMADFEYDGTNFQLVSGGLVINSANGGPLAGSRNRIINGSFAINQRAVTGTVTLAAGVYGHDRWKTGASGCTYTFATSGADTVITITSGSLMQVIEGANIEGGVYALSQAGTAQGRIAINGASTTGAYAAASQVSPLLSASATGGQNVTVEFSTGTVSKVQFEFGSIATPFERRFIQQELALCQRYYQLRYLTQRFPASAANQTFSSEVFPIVTMRATPSSTFQNSISASLVSTQSVQSVQSDGSVRVDLVSSAAGDCYSIDRLVSMAAEL